ncbi:hypothetical protein AVEN_64712-1 [Araneus ventricosus]|uniref:CCHC-type domain-containing protein n=1 Tax=Araneus ventricosus TaxID=182803 RepID=A0A4Y2X1Q3_ARAVE|nr:hypothetical protein AVEN_64712-1 [Araneus ventricosus]
MTKHKTSRSLYIRLKTTIPKIAVLGEKYQIRLDTTKFYEGGISQTFQNFHCAAGRVKDGVKIPKSGLSGKQGSKKAQHAPGPVVKPLFFGQRNPFELQPLGVSQAVSEPVVSGLPKQGPSVGFGLSVGLPPGTKWGDTPYPGVNGDDEGSHVELPVEHKPVADPAGLCPAVSAVEDQVTRPSDDTMDEDPKTGLKRKKDKGKRRKPKVSKGKTDGSIDTSLLNRPSTDSDRTVMSSPHMLVPDTPAVVNSETDTSSEEVPDTPVRARQRGANFERLCPEMKAVVDSFLVKFPGDDNLVKHIWVLMFAIDAQFVGLRKRLEEIEATFAASAVPTDKYFAQAVGQPRPVVRDISTDPPELLGVSGPSREGVVAPQLVSRPRAPQLPPRQSLNALVVTPIGGDIVSAGQLKVLLDNSLHLQSIGVEVLGCSPAANRGVLVRVRTPDMVQVLEQAINTHGSLMAVCVARKPLRRSPRIMLYDVPVTDMVREAEEAAFLHNLRSSNSIPESMDIRVLFRRPGRGHFQHWILSVAPELFSAIKNTNRLFFGFGSFKFREFLEPAQCYKCLRFGHLRATCSSLKELCTKCSGDHSYRVCTATSVACSRCMDFNRRRGTGPKVRTDHSALSVRCPVYLRERDEMGRHVKYV